MLTVKIPRSAGHLQKLLQRGWEGEQRRNKVAITGQERGPHRQRSRTWDLCVFL